MIYNVEYQYYIAIIKIIWNRRRMYIYILKLNLFVYCNNRRYRQI